MKSHIVFAMNDSMIKWLRLTSAPQKSVKGVLDIKGQSDEEISQTLSVFIKKYKLNFSKSRVTLLIPRSRVIIRQIQLPSHNEEEMRSMIDLQLGAHVPYTRQEVEVDFQVLSKTADGYAQAAMVIVPKDVPSRYWRVFSDARIPVDSLTISSIGLWLLYQQQPDVSEELGAIIDVDLNSSEVCLCYKTHWLTCREIPIGQTELHQGATLEFLKQWEMTQKNIGDGPAGKVDLMYVTGALKETSALREAMAPYNLKVKEVPELETPEGISLAALAGVAYSCGPIPIDLTPQAIKTAREKNVYRYQMVISGSYLAAAVVALVLVFSVGFIKKSFQLARLQGELQSLESEAASVESQWQKIRDLEGALKGRLVFADLAGELTRILPAQVSLTNISISDGHTLSLQGISLNPADIDQFQRQMVGSSSFSTVSLDYVNKRQTQQGEVDYFKITCVVKSGPKEK